MSVELTWTCDRCHYQTWTTIDDFAWPVLPPSGWAILPASDGSYRHACPDCQARSLSRKTTEGKSE